jgi:hypothetical protein
MIAKLSAPPKSIIFTLWFGAGTTSTVGSGLETGAGTDVDIGVGVGAGTRIGIEVEVVGAVEFLLFAFLPQPEININTILITNESSISDFFILLLHADIDQFMVNQSRHNEVKKKVKKNTKY